MVRSSSNVAIVWRTLKVQSLGIKTLCFLIESVSRKPITMTSYILHVGGVLIQLTVAVGSQTRQHDPGLLQILQRRKTTRPKHVGRHRRRSRRRWCPRVLLVSLLLLKISWKALRRWSRFHVHGGLFRLDFVISGLGLRSRVRRRCR